MHEETPIAFINGLIDCIDHNALHESLYLRPVVVANLLGYEWLSDFRE